MRAPVKRVDRDDPSDALLRPVLKWAGGKRQLLPQILERLPARIATYYEPFVGGGAVFFALAELGRFERAVIADRNDELVNVYEALRDDLDGVIRELRRHRTQHSEDYFYKLRGVKPRTPATRAARTIYLNKTGYNGLYRVNSRGEFNVPFGRYAAPNILDEPRLERAAAVLQRVDIRSVDFERVCALARPGDAVYLDPPYLPVSATAHFAEYHRDAFGLDEHRRLGRVFGELEARGVAALLSNSDTADTREIFGGYALDSIPARRAINSNAERRGTISELLVQSRPARSARR